VPARFRGSFEVDACALAVDGHVEQASAVQAASISRRLFIGVPNMFDSSEVKVL